MNRQVSELADESRLSMLKSQADALEGLVKELSKMNRLASIGAGSGAGDYAKLRSALKSEYGIQGSVAWDVGDWSEAAQEVLNNIRREIEKIEDAKRRISVPTEMDVRLSESSYRNAEEKFDYLSDFATAMKKEVEGTMALHVDGTHAERDTDSIIAELEGKLKTMEGIPLSVEQQKVKDGLQETLGYMKRWKEMGITGGTFTIPLFST